MRFRLMPVAILVAAIVALAAAQTSSSSPSPATAPNLVVHEWGTFTSVAGAEGQAVQWVPQAGPRDLPCFVERSREFVKLMSGTVRMETPVLYFYSPEAATVRVGVEFKQGFFTEWYPHARAASSYHQPIGFQSTLDWNDVRVTPGQSESFPVEPGASHYYTARHTGATPLTVDTQAEKFLFYRGVGQFQPPLTAIVQEDGQTRVKHARGLPIGDVILFENRRGAMAAVVANVQGAEATLERPALEDASEPPLRQLAKILVAHGLYQKEADAMVETWRDSWFEEGARLLYIVPNADIDAVLPLTIAPKPGSIARVFVGRMELLTPVTLSDVRRALEAGDEPMLKAYGRFLQPIGERVAAAAAPGDRDRLAGIAQQWAWSPAIATGRACR